MLALNETGYAGIALFDHMQVREIDWFVSDRGFEGVIVGGGVLREEFNAGKQ